MEKTWVNIPDVLFFQEGPGVRNTQYTTEGVKLLNVANLVDGKVDLSTSDRYISEEEANGKYKHFLCDAGDFIIASSGIKVEYIDKKMGFVDESMLPLCMNTSTIRFKVLDEHQLRIRYFMYYLKSQHFKEQLFKQITGSAQLNYGPSHLKKMVMPLIDIDKQDEIIACMDKVQAVIEKRQQELVMLDDLIKARFVELFDSAVGSKLCKMSDVCEDISAGGDRPKDTSENRTDEYPYPVFANAATNEGLLCFSREYKIDKPCVTIAARGCTVGFTAVRNEKFTPVVRLISLIPNETITPVFLKHYIDMKMNIEGQGAAQPQLTIPMVKTMEIMVPSIDLQYQFIDFVKQVDKSKFI